MPNRNLKALLIEKKRTPENTAVLALQALVAAADQVDQHWDDSLNEGYPEGLPSFDELAEQFRAWLQKVSSNH